MWMMTSINLILITVSIAVTVTVIDSSKLFVSKSGTDHALCGNETNPCGTLYKASIIMNEMNEPNVSLSAPSEIYIIDGQNEIQINEYLYNLSLNDSAIIYDPCIPIPFDSSLDIMITFNAETITDMTHWYPYTICGAAYNYSNEYLFDGGNSLTISNLIINDYIITNNSYHYPFIRTLHLNASVACNNCIFRNVTSYLDDPNALVYTFAKIHLINNQFIDIETVTNLIFADHQWINKDYVRQVTIENTSFINIVSASSIIYLVASNNDASNEVPVYLSIIDCTFEDISTDVFIIYDESIQSSVHISNVRIHIVKGLIYNSQHLLESSISIYNLSIVSNQLGTEDQTGYLYFNDVDNTDIEYMTVLYLYNISESCEYGETLYNSFLNATCEKWSCINPMKAIENHGAIVVDHLFIDMNVSSETAFTQNDSYYYHFRFSRWDLETALILNTASMDLKNIDVQRSTGYSLIVNQNELSITNLTFDVSNHIRHDPNALQSSVLIYHWGSTTFTSIQQSHFIGTQWQIFAVGGDLEIFNSTFERTSIVMQLRMIDSIIMEGCKIQHIGRYNGVFAEDAVHERYVTAGIQMFNQPHNVVFINNCISGFDPKGLVAFVTAINAVFIDNTMNIDPSGLFYNVLTDDHLHYFHWVFAPLFFAYGVNSTVIGNKFEENTIEPDAPWLTYLSNEGTNCLSGNTFTNAAIAANYSNLTSCARTNLVNYAESDHNLNELNQIYGFIDLSLLDEIGYFIINDTLELEAIIYMEHGNIALDNVNITDLLTIWAQDGNILLVDSYITTGNDILYDADNCKVINNHRLLDRTEYISQLLIQCDGAGDNDVYDLSKTMDSGHTKLVNHMSAVAISIMTESTYYPGQLMKIKYDVMDKIGNVFSYNGSQPYSYDINSSQSQSYDIIFELEGKSFSTDITIDADGTCSICESGVLINTVSINRDIGGSLTMNISVMSNILNSINSELSVPIVGCPIGYGPDLNNASCIQCNTDYYNLVANNVEYCKTCDSNENDAVKCMDGIVHVASDSWMGFHKHSIISAICPSSYCCQNTAGCNYVHQDKQPLCASNRDYESKLCGKCKDGYSESMNSTKCVACKRHYPEYILFPLLLSLWICIFLLFISLDRNTPHKRSKFGSEDIPQTNVAKTKFKALLKNHNFKLMIKTMILKNIFYYEQSVSQLIITSPYQIFMRPFASNFNFSLTSLVAYNDNHLWCFINGLNAKWKIISDLFIAVMVIMLISVLCIVSKYVAKRRFGWKKRTVSFAHAFITMYLIVIGKVLDVLLRLMSCQKVGDFHVHFYFGDEICYRSTWWIAATVLSIIIISFSIIFTKLCLVPNEKRQSRRYTLYRFTARYKPQYYYWEYIIFWRRILIALFAVSVQDITLKFLFIAILMMFLYLQITCDPFLIHEANKMEIILLIALIFIAATKISDVINVTVINLLLSLLIILPIPLLFYYIYILYKVQVIGNTKKTDTKESGSESWDDTVTHVAVGNVNHEQMLHDIHKDDTDTPVGEYQTEHNMNTEIRIAVSGKEHQIMEVEDSIEMEQNQNQ